MTRCTDPSHSNTVTRCVSCGATRCQSHLYRRHDGSDNREIYCIECCIADVLPEGKPTVAFEGEQLELIP